MRTSGIFGGGLGSLIDDLDPLGVGSGWLYDTPPPGKGGIMVGKGTASEPHVYCPLSSPMALNPQLPAKLSTALATIKQATNVYKSGEIWQHKDPDTIVAELNSFGNPFPRMSCMPPDYWPNMQGQIMAAWAEYRQVREMFWKVADDAGRITQVTYHTPEQALAAEEAAGVPPGDHTSAGPAYTAGVNGAEKPKWMPWAIGGGVALMAVMLLRPRKGS
jgi:hypothetical protein